MAKKNIIQEDEVKQLENVTNTLETMRINSTICIPNSQRTTINTTIQRLKDKSKRKFTVKRINDTYFTLKRIV